MEPLREKRPAYRVVITLAQRDDLELVSTSQVETALLGLVNEGNWFDDVTVESIEEMENPT